MSKRAKGRFAGTAIAAAGLLLCVSDPAAAVTGGGNVSIGWSIPNAPSSGLTNITFPITVNSATAHQGGIYFAQQFSFGSNVGYIGLQPRLNQDGKERLHGVFSVFGDGTSSADANCKPGADSGSGVSCGVDFDAVYGHKYNLKVARTGTDTWTGTATDSATGTSIHIGTYTLAPISGNLGRYQAGFVEYYLQVPDCAMMPRSDAVFGGPTSTDAGGLTGKSTANSEYGGDCLGQANYQAAQSGNDAHVTRGFTGTSASTLISKASGKCLDDFNASTDGNPVGIWSCTHGDSQTWTTYPGGRLAGQARCLDATRQGTTAGTNLITWQCNGGTNQQWSLESDGTIRGVASGLCVGVVNASTSNGANVELQNCNGSSGQQWTRG
ncbi:RICIN domain-containing protein [Kitasatospora sp. NBC_00240]|uniref:RICIN domain-containing protein n=1 Tax=Kitasatospora sp. NBC_00240 TaxID=2903567 RepID=UPI00224D768B|nr:RICIN domain-containing protein [Kitasatospora sp. NBC_00240]MCX5208430.1 RICIN domain-containing protein [Kitasatospora sp. NBC_00240]